jgi:dTMP kinase
VVGRLIALEGIDGSGKTTQATLLAAATGARFTFEPGATPAGALLRRLLLDPTLPPLGPLAEALVVSADRARHVAEVLRPALASGEWVVTDRYLASTLAYQGAGRGVRRALLDQLAEAATGGLAADLVVVVDLPVPEARARLAAHRLAGARPGPGDPGPGDRLEAERPAFAEAVRQGFLALAEEDPERVVVVDGRGPVDEVARAIRAVVAARLGDPPGGWR